LPLLDQEALFEGFESGTFWTFEAHDKDH